VGTSLLLGRDWRGPGFGLAETAASGRRARGDVRGKQGVPVRGTSRRGDPASMSSPGPDSGPRALATPRGAWETPQVGRPGETAVQGFGRGQRVSSATDRFFGCGPAQVNRHGCDVRATMAGPERATLGWCEEAPRAPARRASECRRRVWVGTGQDGSQCPAWKGAALGSSMETQGGSPLSAFGQWVGSVVHTAPEREAQESHGRRQSGNGAAAQRTHDGSKASRSVGRQSGNGEGAVACGDVGTARREEELWRAAASVGTPRPPATGRWCGGGGNPMNPMVGSGMQQARETCGEVNRQGGEKPRRRNVTGARQRRSKAHFGGWELASQGMSMEGRIFGQPYGRRSATSRAT